MTVTTGNALALLALVVGAAILDTRTRRIPNLLTGPALLAGVLAHALAGGRAGLTESLAGALVAGAVLFPGWWLGWMGAGDVKLMAAVGAWFAWPQSLFATLLSLMAGGVIALVVAARHRALGRSLQGAALLGAWAASGGARTGSGPATGGIRFPFATAILAGTLIALWFRP